MINKKNNGFTIIEIMVVVALVAILLGIVVVNLSKNRAITRDNIRVADIQNIRLSLEEYRVACGVYPASLDLSANNGRRPGSTCNNTLGDFISRIPRVPEYSSGNTNYLDDQGVRPEDREQYFYYGLSNELAGPCYDYVIGVQLEYGSGNDFADNENANHLGDINHELLIPIGSGHQYDQSCEGSSGRGIRDADDLGYGIYGFRGTDSL